MKKLAYLAGAMENVPDQGLKWRQEYEKELSKLKYKCIIPNNEEYEVSNKDMKSLKKTNIDEYIREMRKFITLDLDFVVKSDIVVCKWEGEVSSGTNGEITYGYIFGVPCYLVTSLPFEEIPGWFLACFSNVFKNLDELIKFLEKKDE